MPIFALPEDQTEALTSTREAYLRIVKLSFEPGQSWRFSDGTATFNAKMNDPEFQKRLEVREEGFYSGDRLHVRFKTIQTNDRGRLKSVYSIEEVISHLPAPRQQHLQ